MEVTELFILRTGGDIADGARHSRINITVTNCAGGWAPYCLWVAAVPPPGNFAPTRLSPGLKVNHSPDSCGAGDPRLLVIHDEYGNIKSVALPAGVLGLVAGLRPQRDQLITELKETQLGLEELRRSPGAISENFRVDTNNRTLVPKSRYG